MPPHGSSSVDLPKAALIDLARSSVDLAKAALASGLEDASNADDVGGCTQRHVPAVVDFPDGVEGFPHLAF